MGKRWLWLYLTGLVLAALVAELAWYYPQLPPRVATHFDMDGQANGWGSKHELLAPMVGVVLVLAVTLLPSVWVMKYLPARWVNLPHRDYWLAPERADTTRRMLMDRMGWFCCATMLLMAAVFHSVLHANLRQPPTMSAPVGILVAYLLFVGVWLTELLWRFYHPRA